MPENQSLPKGFDAPVEEAAHDHLNRWPLAFQIYNVAANGPIDWSVRIGVYGEWGTGKTSVLKFVSSMAEQDGHIVVWFDPWEYTKPTEMWRAYVEAVYKKVEAKLGTLEEGERVRRKAQYEKISRVVTTIAGLWKEQAADLTKDGFGLVKNYLSSGADDLAAIRHVMGGKRIFLIIDDLDRTAAELVPDILYTLKEIMDIPGFSFICGFDPVVVGKVLGAKHPGFGDGLKFLEKIIDYPIWLPAMKNEGLMKIALGDAKLHCPFVPTESLRLILPSLPPTPRAIRQFIRLLSLLRTQTDRYYDHELRWSVILASTALKVLYPKVAGDLLDNRNFWHALSALTITNGDSWEKSEAAEDIQKHIQATLEFHGQKIEDRDRSNIGSFLHRIATSISFWNSDDVDLIISQIFITELPQAVSLKEFDTLLESLDYSQILESLKRWISEHAKKQHHREEDVGTELCIAAVDRYCSELHHADVGFYPEKTPQHEEVSRKSFRLLEVLVFECVGVLASLRDGTWVPLRHIYDKLASLYSASGPLHAAQWPLIEKFLCKLARNCAADAERLRAVVFELLRKERGDAKERKLLNELNMVVDEHVCHIAATGLTQEGFVDRALNGQTDLNAMSHVIRNWDLPEYREFRSLALSHFKNDMNNPNVRENSFRVLDWFEGAFRHQGSNRKHVVVRLLQDKEMVDAIWNAATYPPFSERHAHDLRELPKIFEAHGINVFIPPWWEESIKKREDFIQSLAPKAKEPVPTPAV